MKLYLIVTNKKITENYSFINKVNSFSDEEETAKIPISLFQKLNETHLAEKPILSGRIILLQSKKEYEQYYSNIIYSIMVKSETQNCWLGTSLKNPSVGLLKWEKKIWNKIYELIIDINVNSI